MCTASTPPLETLKPARRLKAFFFLNSCQNGYPNRKNRCHKKMNLFCHYRCRWYKLQTWSIYPIWRHTNPNCFICDTHQYEDPALRWRPLFFNGGYFVSVCLLLHSVVDWKVFSCEANYLSSTGLDPLISRPSYLPEFLSVKLWSSKL